MRHSFPILEREKRREVLLMRSGEKRPSHFCWTSSIGFSDLPAGIIPSRGTLSIRAAQAVLRRSKADRRRRAESRWLSGESLPGGKDIPSEFPFV